MKNCMYNNIIIFNESIMSKFINDLSIQLKMYNHIIPKLTKTIVRPLIQLAGGSIEGHSYNGDPLALVQARVGPSEELPEFYTLVLVIMQSFFRAPYGSVKLKEIKQCLHEMDFKSEVIEDICSALFGSHALQLTTSFAKSSDPLKRANCIIWKIDISLIHSEISHLAHPTVILKICFSNGQSKTFEVTTKLFHKMRQNIALILHNMIALENRNSLKHI